MLLCTVASAQGYGLALKYRMGNKTYKRGKVGARGKPLRLRT